MLIEITLSADEGDVGALSDALIECGALSVSIEDAQANTEHEQPLYGEPGFAPAPTAWSGRACESWPRGIASTHRRSGC